MKTNFSIAIRMENYIPLLYKLSISCWRKLPVSHQAWVSVDDLVQDGMLFARYNLVPRYEIQRASFMTLLQSSLEQFYSRKLRSLYRKKRMHLDVVQEEKVLLSNVLSSQSAVDKIFEEASPLLQGYMHKWFFSDDGSPQRIRISEPFKKARREFKKLATKYNVDASTCRTVLESRKQKSLA